MIARTDAELQREIAALQAELARRADEAADKERQLERYAADLRETFKQERARAPGAAALLHGHRARAVQRRRGARRVHRQARRARHRLRAADRTGDAAGAGRSRRQIEFGFLLHDIGKLAIPDAILFKPGPLTERGARADGPPSGDRRARSSARSSSWPSRCRSSATTTSAGTARGYPDGLRGEDIPLAARIFAVADVLDALTTDRPYRPASPLAEAREMILAEPGTHFDPEIIEAFAAIPVESLLRRRRPRSDERGLRRRS